jgi:3-isopropylmalate/(R)-2-methylmalate dehydratase large subunit
MSFELSGRVLVLYRDPALVREQLEAGASSPVLPLRGPLRDRVSTDEITPAWACYYFDARLARYCLVGLEGAPIEPGRLASGGFSVLIAGESFGYGSSRETAPFSLREAGIRLIVAKSFEKIFLQNCQNLGVYAVTDFELAARLLAGERLELDELCGAAQGLEREIVRAGGLFAHQAQGAPRPSSTRAEPSGARRPMTLVEKIIAQHVVTPAGEIGVSEVEPGEVHFVRTDLRFSHDYVTAMADAVFRAGFGEDARVSDPASLVLFRDHLPLLEHALSERHRRLALYDHALELARAQQRFAERHGLALYEAGAELGYGICHNVILERLAQPGSVIAGTDSHTCTAGAVGALAFGVGSTDMACAFKTRAVRVRVPETIQVDLVGELPRGTCAKDVVLALLASEAVQTGRTLQRMLEFTGPGLACLNLDERATLTNMAVEASAFSGTIAPDELVWRELSARRGAVMARSTVPSADPGAHYAETIRIDLTRIEPMLATPSDPRNALPLRLVPETRIDIAYAGSCTGSKSADMDAYATVLQRGLAQGRRVAPHVRLYVQPGSVDVRRYAEQRGYLELFRTAGATLLEPACGACIGAGPGVSEHASQVTVSAMSRNFPGRSGPGQVYLASPWVVAESALAGVLAAPAEWKASA